VRFRYLYNLLGYKRLHVPHGWRAAFSSTMNQRAEREHVGDGKLLIDRLIVDLMLAQVPTGMSATEFRYNRALTWSDGARSPVSGRTCCSKEVFSPSTWWVDVGVRRHGSLLRDRPRRREGARCCCSVSTRDAGHAFQN